MVTKGLIVRLEAKSGQEDALEAFLGDALALVEEERQTIAWFALRNNPASFAIVDVFPDDDSRQEHLNGRGAAALIGRADELLAAPPEITHVDVLAAKLP
jgi:quinol monooxygenase YgiN